MPRLRNIDDAQLLRAMTHPLRLRLLGTLIKDGPATASELARRLGESSGATSYHLRILAKYVFIEDDAERNRGRERWSAGGRPRAGPPVHVRARALAPALARRAA